MFSSGTDFPGGWGVRTPTNYIYFDLIVSYLIILTTKFVKLPLLWSQILPCRPRKQILLNFSLGLSGRCHQAPAKASSSTPPPDIYPPPERKYENPSLVQFPKMWLGTVFCPPERSVSFWNKSAINKNILIIQVVQLST